MYVGRGKNVRQYGDREAVLKGLSGAISLFEIPKAQNKRQTVTNKEDVRAN